MKILNILNILLFRFFNGDFIDEDLTEEYYIDESWKDKKSFQLTTDIFQPRTERILFCSEKYVFKLSFTLIIIHTV